MSTASQGSEKWRGYSSRLDARLKVLGIELTKDDRSMLGDLEVTYRYGLELPALLERLVAEDGKGPKRFAQGVSDVLALLGFLRSAIDDVEPCADRLLSAANLLPDPGEFAE